MEDCIQDLFYYLWQHREGLGETDNIRRYLFTALRRRIIEQMSDLRYTEMPFDAPSTPCYESILIERETTRLDQQRLQRVLEVLPERQQEAVSLKYFQNLDCSQIAAAMNIHRRAVYKLLTKAIRKLRRAWAANVDWQWVAVG